LFERSQLFDNLLKHPDEFSFKGLMCVIMLISATPCLFTDLNILFEKNMMKPLKQAKDIKILSSDHNREKYSTHLGFLPC